MYFPLSGIHRSVHDFSCAGIAACLLLQQQKQGLLDRDGPGKLELLDFRIVNELHNALLCQLHHQHVSLSGECCHSWRPPCPRVPRHPCCGTSWRPRCGGRWAKGWALLGRRRRQWRTGFDGGEWNLFWLLSSCCARSLPPLEVDDGGRHQHIMLCYIMSYHNTLYHIMPISYQIIS